MQEAASIIQAEDDAASEFETMQQDTTKAALDNCSKNTTRLPAQVASVVAHIACDDTGSDSPEGDASGDVYIDPSGTIETRRGVPVAGATVTLARSATSGGPLAPVPNGSAIMSPANRRNPSRSNALGQFGWDTIPGYYRIGVAHRGCRAANGRGRRTRTALFGVPPARSGLVLRLRCPGLRRTATKLRLHVVRGPLGTLVVTARLVVRHARPHALVGSVVVRAGGRVASTTPIDARTGTALVDVPGAHTKTSIVARFTGNALYAPSRARG